MSTVQPGRYTAQLDGDFIVFIIGMRINRLLNDLHWPAWRDYNKTIGASGKVGVYHETYKVHAGDYEAIYANMAPFGLAKAGSFVPVRQVGDASRDRITKFARSPVG